MDKPNLLIIGAGGVASVAAHKAAQFKDDFGQIALASRSMDKVERIAADLEVSYGVKIDGRQADVRDPKAMAALLEETEAKIVLNLASPYCNESVLDACLAAGAHYLDTAVAEREHVENMAAPWYEYVEWPRADAFEEKEVTALLGIGFDPGVVNVFCAHAKKHLLDEVESIDIIDVNGGDHGRYFATNFDAETNLREIKEDVLYWEEGEYKSIPHHSRMMEVTLPEVGRHKVYSMGHDELHSLPLAFPEAKRIEFWMGFGDHYLKVFNVLDNLGLTSSMPIEVGGQEVVPVRVVKALLPDPASLASGYTGKCVIGCDIRGKKGGQEKRYFIYSVCDHTKCFADVGSQAISYTTGVPVITAARLLVQGDWNNGKMNHVEKLDPDPFLKMLPEVGIDWQVAELPLDGSWPV